MNKNHVPKNNIAFKEDILPYLSLLAAIIFFSGFLKSQEWYGAFDFSTLMGKFGSIIANDTSLGSFRGKGGDGARDGFLFAFTLIPGIMFAMASVAVFEHYGALKAATQIFNAILKPLMGIPGSSSISLIASLQSTDAGAALTRNLEDEKLINPREKAIFASFQFSGGAMIVNFFSSGAPLLLLTDVPASIGLIFVVIFCMKFVGANIMRFCILRVVKIDELKEENIAYAQQG